jgi:hypothetical protein
MFVKKNKLVTLQWGLTEDEVVWRKPACARFRNFVFLSPKHVSRNVERVRGDVRADSEKKFETGRQIQVEAQE